jgi:hypothetical protein
MEERRRVQKSAGVHEEIRRKGRGRVNGQSLYKRESGRNGKAPRDKFKSTAETKVKDEP